jgi:FkbM family methyltransferase
MSKHMLLSWLVFLSTVFLGAGCSEEPPEVETPPSAKAEGPQAESRKALQKKRTRKRLEKAVGYFSEQPGRTGILAEENRYSLFSEELMIRDFFQDRRGGFFVDVGCAWPIKASNTYYLEKHLGWTGIGVDALDDFAAGWKEKRPNSKFFAYLVTDRSDALGTFYKSEGLGLSSTNRELASGKLFGENKETEEIQVPTITLDDLLDREGIEKVDLLAMDIEGHELTALRGFDLERFQPELLVIEGASRKVKKHLSDHGYEQIERYTRLDRVNRYFRRTQADEAPANPSPGS